MVLVEEIIWEILRYRLVFQSGVPHSERNAMDICRGMACSARILSCFWCIIPGNNGAIFLIWRTLVVLVPSLLVQMVILTGEINISLIFPWILQLWTITMAHLFMLIFLNWRNWMFTSSLFYLPNSDFGDSDADSDDESKTIHKFRFSWFDLLCRK